MVECRSEQHLFVQKESRRFLAIRTVVFLVTNHNEPKGDGPGVVVGATVEGADWHLLAIITDVEILFFELNQRQKSLWILRDDIDQNERRSSVKYWRRILVILCWQWRRIGRLLGPKNRAAEKHEKQDD